MQRSLFIIYVAISNFHSSSVCTSDVLFWIYFFSCHLAMNPGLDNGSSVTFAYWMVELLITWSIGFISHFDVNYRKRRRFCGDEGGRFAMYFNWLCAIINKMFTVINSLRLHFHIKFSYPVLSQTATHLRYIYRKNYLSVYDRHK